MEGGNKRHYKIATKHRLLIVLNTFIYQFKNFNIIKLTIIVAITFEAVELKRLNYYILRLLEIYYFASMHC